MGYGLFIWPMVILIFESMFGGFLGVAGTFDWMQNQRASINPSTPPAGTDALTMLGWYINTFANSIAEVVLFIGYAFTIPIAMSLMSPVIGFINLFLMFLMVLGLLDIIKPTGSSGGI